MTEKEIEALAMEYADTIVDPISAYYLGECGNASREEDLRTVCDDVVIPLLQWLSECYEIVSKERVRDEYDHAKRTRDLYMSATCINTMESRAIDHSIGRMYELTKLFPQTLKSEEK